MISLGLIELDEAFPPQAGLLPMREFHGRCVRRACELSTLTVVRNWLRPNHKKFLESDLPGHAARDNVTGVTA